MSLNCFYFLLCPFTSFFFLQSTIVLFLYNVILIHLYRKKKFKKENVVSAVYVLIMEKSLKLNLIQINRVYVNVYKNVLCLFLSYKNNYLFLRKGGTDLWFLFNSV